MSIGFSENVVRLRSDGAIRRIPGRHPHPRAVKLNESARVATVVNSEFQLIKSLAIITEDAGLEGVKITQQIDYRNFVTEVALKADTLEMYAPLKLIKQFADDNITSQQFLDHCIVILNSSRVQVVLSNGS
jgi:hypothetical protein